jgi:DNA-directed RNA polymerase subunit beta
MIVSSSLGAVPFLGNTDATRLQMCGKQLNQAVTHPNCKRPYVIGDDYFYLSEMSKFYKYIAPHDGKITYSGNGITILLLDGKNLRVFETPKFKHCANGFATKLIYHKTIGDFKKGDIIFEYDSFNEDVPCYGYNLNTAYMPWFGLNFEDAIAISESAADLMRTNKVENIIIPIYTHSLFRNLYNDSKYGFIPEVGQKISDNVILYQSVPKDEKNKNQLLKSISLYDLTSIAEDNFLFNSVPVISKLPGGILTKLKVHHINRNLKLADEKNLEKKLEFMVNEYGKEVKVIHDNIAELFGDKYARRIISNHHIMQRYGTVGSKKKIKEKIGLPVDMRRDDLVYVLELEITKEYKTKIGDKISNRYANKGVISQIIPDELRPINTKTEEPIDIIVSPLSVFSRMN